MKFLTPGILHLNSPRGREIFVCEGEVVGMREGYIWNKIGHVLMIAEAG